MHGVKIVRSVVGWVVPMCLFASSLRAQTIDQLRQQFRLPVPEAPDLWTVPAMGANTPSGFGAGWVDAYLGTWGTTRARFTERSFADADGAVGMGLGIGDPRSYFGLEITAASYSTFNSGFGTRAGLSLHLHRIVFGDFGLAVGWENALARGTPDSGESLYAVVSKWFQLKDSDSAPFSAIMLSLGMGDGRFRSQGETDNDVDALGVFGSLAVRIAAPASVVADWTGQDLTALLSLTPFGTVSLILSGGWADITGRTGDRGARLVGAVSYGFNFLGR